MSPFYRKEGENWIPLRPPIDIQVGNYYRDVVQVFPEPSDEEQIDEEQIRIAVSGDLIARVEGGQIVYPEETDMAGMPPLIKRRDIVIEHTKTGERKMIIHSKKPIGERD